MTATETQAPTRYLVEWTPWAAVKTAATKLGMPKGGEVADYVQIEDYERSETFQTFDKALTFANSVAEADTWHCPRIRRQTLVPNDHDDLGNCVKPMPSYETEATWEVFAGAAAPVEATPDWRDEAA